MDTVKLGIALEPTRRRRPYFLEDEVEYIGPAPAIAPAAAPPERAQPSLMRLLGLYALATLQLVGSAVGAVLAESHVTAALCLSAMFVAGAAFIAISYVLAEEIVYRLRGALPQLLWRARGRWARLRRILRALAGGATALS